MAIGRFSSDSPREERAAALADSLYTLPIPYVGGPVDAGLISIKGLTTFQPCWAKPADSADGSWILRCHETHGRRGYVRLCLQKGATATAVDLMEAPLDIQPDDEGIYPVRPYALIGFRIFRD